MSSKEKHVCFQEPKDSNIKIWHYMDFTKYIAFLNSKSLYFSRVDLLNDPYEGSTSYANEKLRDVVYKDNPIPEKIFAQMSEVRKWNRQWTYVNCWHMNEYESAAMWKLYSQTNESVAIQSTFSRLKKCLPRNIFIGEVKYIDYEKEWLPEGNMFWPIAHKRKSFEYERELRAVLQDVPCERKTIQFGLQNLESGKLISIDPEQLVERVFISPSAPVWFAELVQKVTKLYAFNFEINQSLLAKQPIY